MKVVLWIILISVFIELLTLFGRLVMHRRGEKIQKKFHLPRIHHFYIGLVLVFTYFLGQNNFYLGHQLVIIFGLAFMVSDFLHHIIFIPVIKKYKYDVGMLNHRGIHNYLHASLAIIMIVIGIFALLTPFTPGSWLVPIGIVALIGHDKTKKLFIKILGERFYKKLKLDLFLKDRRRGKWRDAK